MSRNPKIRENKIMWSFQNAPRSSKSSHKLWTDCSSKQLAQGPSQVASGIGLHQSPSQMAKNQYNQCSQLQRTSEQDRISFTSSMSKGRSRQAPNPIEMNSTSYGQQLHSSSHAVVGVEPHSQPA